MKKIKPGFVILGGVLLVLIIAGFKAAEPAPPSYPFITQDHPIDMWKDGNDKWAYYSMNDGTPADLAKKVRGVLTAQGFTEDTSQTPWFVFTKGNNEVVVCNHNEFGVNQGIGSGKLLKPAPYTGSPMMKSWPCVLVKNGPGTETSVVFFQVKKLIHGW